MNSIHKAFLHGERSAYADEELLLCLLVGKAVLALRLNQFIGFLWDKSFNEVVSRADSML